MFRRLHTNSSTRDFTKSQFSRWASLWPWAKARPVIPAVVASVSEARTKTAGYYEPIRGRTFLGFRVVLGTLEITSKDLIAQCLDAPDGMRIVVQALSTFLILIIVIIS